MSWIAIGVIGAGALMGGTSAMAGGNKSQKRAIEAIAGTPGLDIEGITRDRLTGMESVLPQATALAGREAAGRQSQINQLIEQSMPGFTAARDQGTAAATDLIAGRVPSDVSDLVQRSSAARALGGGFAGSGMHRNLVGRDLGLTSIGLKTQGLQWLQALRGMSPAIAPQSAFTLTGPTPGQAVGIRGDERTQRMELLAQAAGIPRSSQVWGGMFQDLGGMLLGGAVSGGLGGMGGGGKSSGSAGGATSIRIPSGSRYQGFDWSDEFLS